MLDRIVGTSPFFQPLDIPAVANPVIEIAAVNCPNDSTVDFTLALKRINSSLPIRHINSQRPIFSPGTSTRERWFFEASEGELISLSLRKDITEAGGSVQILAPNSDTIYRGNFAQEIEQTLLLKNAGIYIVEVISGSSPYTMQLQRVGNGGIPFSSQTPIYEEILDIVSPPQTWQISVETGENATLIVENPEDERIIGAKSTQLHGPRIDAITFTAPGRYSIKVYADTAPDSVQKLQVFDAQLDPGDTIKGTLTALLPANRWRLPVTAGSRFNLQVEGLTPGATVPAAAILDQSGLLVEPETSLSTDTRTIFSGIEPDEMRLFLLLPCRGVLRRGATLRRGPARHFLPVR